MKRIKIVVATFLVAVVSASQGAIKLGAPFTDGMILQREAVVPVWGMANASEKVTVEFAGQVVNAVAAQDGKWLAELKPMVASAESRVMTVKGAIEKIEIKDVLVGEVWYCSGQSNADVPLCGGNPCYRDGIKP